MSAMILLCYGITHLPSGKFLVIEISTRLLSTRREKHDFAVLHAMSHTTGHKQIKMKGYEVHKINIK